MRLFPPSTGGDAGRRTGQGRGSRIRPVSVSDKKYGTLPNVGDASAGLGSRYGFQIDSGGGSDDHHTDEDGGRNGRGGEISDREPSAKQGGERDRWRGGAPRRHSRGRGTRSARRHEGCGACAPRK